MLETIGETLQLQHTYTHTHLEIKAFQILLRQSLPSFCFRLQVGISPTISLYYRRTTRKHACECRLQMPAHVQVQTGCKVLSQLWPFHAGTSTPSCPWHIHKQTSSVSFLCLFLLVCSFSLPPSRSAARTCIYYSFSNQLDVEPCQELNPPQRRAEDSRERQGRGMGGGRRKEKEKGTRSKYEDNVVSGGSRWINS